MGIKMVHMLLKFNNQIKSESNTGIQNNLHFGASRQQYVQFNQIVVSHYCAFGTKPKLKE